MLEHLDFTELPDGFIPIEGLTILKGVDSSGHIGIVVRYTSGLSPWEAIGMLRVAENSELDHMRHAFDPD